MGEKSIEIIGVVGGEIGEGRALSPPQIKNFNYLRKYRYWSI
jgi:hypothetical protein